MRILAIDSAAGACSAAVWDHGVVHERLRQMTRGHAEALLPLVLDVLRDAGRTFAEFDLLAVTMGPGAFTGLRIGLAAARGIALATELPCMGVTTLEAVAEAVIRSTGEVRPLLVALDTRRGDVYAQVFAAGGPLGQPSVENIEEMAERFIGQNVIVAGDAAAPVIAALRRRGASGEQAIDADHPMARHVAAIAARRWATGVRPALPGPLYLRPPATGPQRCGPQ